MALKLLVDECIADKQLIVRLRIAGQDVITVADIGLIGKPDQEIFERTIIEERLLLTANIKDYSVLAKQQTARGLKHLEFYLKVAPGIGPRI